MTSIHILPLAEALSSPPIRSVQQEISAGRVAELVEIIVAASPAG